MKQQGPGQVKSDGERVSVCVCVRINDWFSRLVQDEANFPSVTFPCVREIKGVHS